MSGLRNWIGRAAVAVLLALSMSPALAGKWAVAGQLNGKPDRQTGEPRISVDMSGIACAQPRGVPLEEGGLTLEGIAVMKGRLYAGFRGPLIERDGKKDHALIMSVALDYVFGNAPADMRKYAIKLGDNRGIRDLAVYDKGILILAGPMNSSSGTYAIYRWDGQSNDARRLDDLPDFFSDRKASRKDGVQWKPEAVLPLDRNSKGLRVLLLLDSARNGEPRTMRIRYK